LPANGETEGVEAIVSDEVLHLVEASLARVDNVAAARAVGSTAKVETGDVDTGKLDAARRGVADRSRSRLSSRRLLRGSGRLDRGGLGGGSLRSSR